MATSVNSEDGGWGAPMRMGYYYDDETYEAN